MPDTKVSADLKVQFHHVQVFVHKTKSLKEYKELEEDLNRLAHLGHYDPFSGGMRFLEPKAHSARVTEGRKLWQSIRKKNDRSEELSAHQDFVEQLIIGLGWRVTATYDGAATSSFLVTSSDPRGVKLCVTSINDPCDTNQKEPYEHFNAGNVRRFLSAHQNRQGFAVLGFEVGAGQCVQILDRYKMTHPRLLVSGYISQYKDTRSITQQSDKSVETFNVDLGSMSVLDVYAYYSDGASGDPDTGTVLRFVERHGTFAEAPGFSNPSGVLPGLVDADPRFDGSSIPSYADHWVSNVVDRERFLQTLGDVLGFEPKVDFNAGVISAGRASIESTVVGNTSAALLFTEFEALRDQSQIFLPVNNALSASGHVHAFLAEIGQGVQHIASRVEDLVSFVERVSNYREMTGGGLTFLDIPRSYYGILTTKFMVEQDVPEELADAVYAALVAEGLVDSTGIVDLEVTGAQVAKLRVADGLRPALEGALAAVKRAVKRGRYSNLYTLLGERLTEEEYLHVVRNRILVDAQGEDVLLQIFTGKVLQERPEHEAPFLEFIQRVCKVRKEGEGTRPGCGGFGIRNFLTLFLSIELSKAMADVRRFHAAGDAAGEAAAQRRMELFSRQLEESNPILTAISDAMRDEGLALEALARASAGDEGGEERRLCAARAATARAAKEAATARLQELSRRYDELMRAPASG